MIAGKKTKSFLRMTEYFKKDTAYPGGWIEYSIDVACGNLQIGRDVVTSLVFIGRFRVTP